jgi:hypothetical protein
LIKQRLKQVMIGTVYERDAHGRVAQGLRAGESAEACTDDDDVG